MNENLFKLTQRRRNLLISPVLNVLVVCEAQACASSTPPFLWDTHVCFFKSFFFVTRLQLVPKSSPRLLNCHRFFSENLCKLNILSSNVKARPLLVLSSILLFQIIFNISMNSGFCYFCASNRHCSILAKHNLYYTHYTHTTQFCPKKYKQNTNKQKKKVRKHL